MYRRALNYLRGSAVVEVTAPAPERVVNLCAAHGIPFWDVTWLREDAFRLSTTLSGARRLAEVTAETAARVTVLRREGAPELWHRGRNRYVLLAAAVLLPLLLVLTSGYIWDLDVSGNTTVPTESVLQALERCGVTVGTRGAGLDQDDLRNRVLPLLPDVVYLAVNVRGCTAHVQVVERTRPPHLYRDGDIQNIVASRDGLLTKIEALDGVTCVSVGDTVRAGDVLLSGAAESPRGTRYLRATGRIWARTWYQWTVSVPLTAPETAPQTDVTRRIAVDLGRKRINFFSGGSVLAPDCDKITKYHPLRLPFGLRLPLTLVVETVSPTAPAVWSQEDARRQGEAQLLSQLTRQLGQEGEILRTEFSARQQDSYLLVSLWAECQEQIGTAVPLSTNDTAS